MSEPRTLYTSRLKECIIKLQKAVELRDEREAIRVQRRLQFLRKACWPAVLRDVYMTVVSPPASRQNAEALFEHIHNMNVWSEDTANRTAVIGDATTNTEVEVEESRPTEEMGDEPAVDSLLKRISTDEQKAEAVPHIQLWFTILTIFLVVDTYVKSHRTEEQQPSDQQALLDLGCQVALECPKFIKLTRRKAIDTLDAKAYFAMSRLFNMAKRGQELRTFFLEEFRTAALERKLLCQATLINQLMQSYIDSCEFDTAIKFVLKTTFPENVRSTAQVVRCLFNLGRIQAVRLEYSDAHEKLTAAVRKLPPNENFARGFKLQAHKYAIVVELLMGDVPEVSIFRDEHRLHAYEGIVQAVRTGDLKAFESVLKKYTSEFKKDGTFFLVERLHHSVIKAGLRRINNSYSHISLADIAEKLGIQSAADAEGIVAKAIMDGVVTGVIDADTQCLISKNLVERYKTTEPAEAFNKRINFCAAMYKEAVKACI